MNIPPVFSLCGDSSLVSAWYNVIIVRKAQNSKLSHISPEHSGMIQITPQKEAFGDAPCSDSPSSAHGVPTAFTLNGPITVMDL